VGRRGVVGYSRHVPVRLTDDEQSTAVAERFARPFDLQVRFLLTVLDGPDRGRTVHVDGLSPSSVVLGQSPVCNLQLTDPSVSRRHVALDVVPDGLSVKDLGSTNGTFLSGVRVRDAHARGGETLIIGGTTLGIAVESSAGAAALPAGDRFGDIIGTSRAMRRLFPLLERLAQASLPILVEGETGTGKEAVAQAIHENSLRASQPFVLFDCTTISGSLIESELFGHEKGAFTGATSLRRGVFERAAGGTLFIDELGDLPLDLQAKLLRAIDTGQVRRVGGDRWIQCDARLIAATRRDLEAMIQEGRFRDDLFHRLAVGRVALPPLREREGDVPLLIERFCQATGASMAQLRRSRVEGWLTHSWPGNVRELRNAVARELALGELGADEPPRTEGPKPPAGHEHLQPPTNSARTEPPRESSAGRELDALIAALLPYDEARFRAIEIFQEYYVEQALAAAGGSVPKAAAAAGIAVRYFHLLRAKLRRAKS